MDDEVDQLTLLFDTLYDLLSMDKEELTKKLFEIVKAHPEYILEIKEQEKATSNPDHQDLTENVEALLTHLLRDEKIKAIKIYRHIFNLGLKDAKNAVDQLHARVKNEMVPF